MIRLTDTAITSLMAVYAKYFVEDFAVLTLSNLQGSYPAESEYLNALIRDKAEIATESLSPKMKNENSATRFLCECAVHVLEKGIANPESREVYNQVKDLPSRYHQDIAQLAFSAAGLYHDTLDRTVINVVARDANDVAQLIANDIDNRTKQEETGGRVKHFGWGILADGVWLNKALTQAFDTARIFRPGLEADIGWSRSGFQYAQQSAYLPSMSREDKFAAMAAFESMIEKADADIMGQSLSDNSYTLKDLLFVSTALHQALDQCEKGLKNPRDMVNAVVDLSAYVTQADHLITLSKSLGEDGGSAFIEDRLTQISKSATLALAAFEALRETRYSDSLILYVDPDQNGDPTVDVFVNKDTLNRFVNEGGDETDLIKFGNYLDPRKGGISPIAGWRSDWVQNNRDAVVAKVSSEEEDRTHSLRANDALVIKNCIESRVSDLALTYAQARGMVELDKATNEKIRTISRDAVKTEGAVDYSMSTEIAKLLCDMIDDPFVTRTTNLFLNAANSEDEDVRTQARLHAVVGSALYDAGTLF